MKLLHIDSSILGDNSASRQLSSEVVKAWQAAEPTAVVTYRDLAADAVVIAAPMYNFTIPTQLKAWIDRIAVAGQTFHYTEAGPEGLCGGKKVVIVSTSGGLHAGQATGVAHEEYLKVLFGFLGITDIEFVRAHGLAYGDDVRTKAMSDAHTQISEQLFAAA
jgi:FMN-dependent NADH-azoreductase